MPFDLQYHILTVAQRQLYEQLKEQKWVEQFYLAGGTALALQLGHRKSDDFDFFSEQDFSNDDIASKMMNIGQFKRISEEKNTLHGFLHNIRISFLGYRYPLLQKPLRDKYIRLASIKDIACMKLSAIVNRGSKKDFIDIFYILHEIQLIDLLKLYGQKFNIKNYDYTILKALVYFEDAENDPFPIMIKNITWEKVKEFVREKVMAIGI